MNQKESATKPETRRPYRKPVLVEYGGVEELTRGGVGPLFDGGAGPSRST